jgi:DNA-binding transcriptional LysR family regulator
MELRHLRYFVAVAESLHFGQAAATLGIAQPSLSHQIRQLESELQTMLLRRTKRRVDLTDAGRLFLEEARDIVARADRAAVMARRVGRPHAKRLRVGVGYCMDHMCVALLLGTFNARHREAQVELRTLPVATQVAALRDGRLDVGFVRPISDPGLNTEVVITEPLVVALPPYHRLASRRRIAVSSLANEPLILPPRDAVPVFHDTVLKACRKAGFVPNAPHEADHMQMILGMVAAGAGVGLVPAAARKTKPHRVVFRPLHPAADSLQTAVAWRRDDQSPLVAEFLVQARRTLAATPERRLR